MASSAGSRHVDGPEYSTDGAWIYLNTEEFGTGPGSTGRPCPRHGGNLQQLVVLRYRRLVPAPVT